ncbi:DUF917 family protein [Bradyrhizobium prioriisuperbiae]|uniref:S-methyl thiohydantoin desulfurase domain-containing protein n=1 Tax=Bradyrhizobium prioriisuperbiae TaxID=2854389 RepID=UPI0028E820E6|nr:DUF917 family protein [Bradyrhizobium prioritasuperba]
MYAPAGQEIGRRLTRDDVEAAVLGGLLLSAGGSGGSGIARNRFIGEMALAYSGVRLVQAEELSAEDLAIVTSGIGAPASSKPRTEPRHAVESARLLIQDAKCYVAAVMPAHVPGMNAWLVASVLGLGLLDAATNGRGHPTPKLGAMGLASSPDVALTQAAVGGGQGEPPLSLLARGNLSATSEIMRNAAVSNGGLILASRGPFAVDWIRQRGAAGALSFQIDLGRTIVDAASSSKPVLDAVAHFLKGDILALGRVKANSVAFDGAFDVGHIDIDGGRIVRLGVCNEYMYADGVDGRAHTFPDLIATVDPKTGIALEVSELREGVDVAVVAARKETFPLGSGVLDPAAYDEIEQAMNVDLKSYALHETPTATSKARV